RIHARDTAYSIDCLVFRSLPYIILHPNQWLNSNEDVIEHNVYSVITAMYVFFNCLVGVLALEEKVRILSTNLENTTNTLKYSETLYDQAKIEKREWEVKFVESLASDKSSASETYDFTSCVSSPKTNDSFSTVDVNILPKYDVKDPSPTNGFPSCSFKENVKPTRNLCNKSGLADRIHCKNNFVSSKKCFVCGSKSHLIKDCDVYDTVDPFLLASRNRPASIHASRHIPAGRINKPASFPAGRSVPTGWTNPAARPFFRPTNLYFDNVYWPGIYDYMSINKGRWGSAVKSSAGCSWRYNRPYMKWGSKNNGGSHQSTWFRT
nr:hypothetical protein [Tanacetum cinerariifolium]